MNALTRWLLRSLLCSVACSVLYGQVLACGFCDFTGVIVRGNSQSGSLTVPAGSTVTLTASKKFGSDCTRLICNWTLNGVDMPWPGIGPVYYKFNTPGTYYVEAYCECAPCDRFGSGYLTVYVTSDPPPPVGPPVTITYTTFIPLDHVRLPEPYEEYFYEADNKGSHTPGETSFRIQQTVTVRTGEGIVLNPDPTSAESRYFQANVPTTNLTTSGDCYRKNCPTCPNYSSPFPSTPIVYQGQCLIRTAQDSGHGMAERMDTIKAELIDAGHYDANRNFVKVRLSGAPHVGVSPIWWSPIDPPAIDWNVTIELTRNKSTGVTAYNVAGGQDGFPYHDIRLNSIVVWQRDPIPTNTPTSLAWPMDVSISAQGSF